MDVRWNASCNCYPSESDYGSYKMPGLTNSRNVGNATGISRRRLGVIMGVVIGVYRTDLQSEAHHPRFDERIPNE
jgi:hypothetical protein